MSDDIDDDDEAHEKDLQTENNIIQLPNRPSHKTMSDEIPIHSRKDAVEWVDKHFAITWIVGKFMIINERIPDQFVLMTKKDFIDSLENIRIRITDENGDSKVTPISKLWLEYPQRRTYELGIIFDPQHKFDSKTMRSGAYNTWPGFAIQPKKGDCHLNMGFYKDIICSGNQNHFHYETAWKSQMLREPWNKLGVALVLKGLKGIGKSYYAKVLGMLMDGHNNNIRKQKLYLPLDSKLSIFGNHNDHFESKLLVCLEEAIWAGDKAHESTLKHLITGDTLFVNPKNLPGRTVNNYMRTIIIGNADWIVPASYDERRFFVLNVNPEHKDDKAYFDALEYELFNGGLEALMYELMNYDYSDVNLRTALVTEAQVEQKIESMSGVEKWWFDLLSSGKLPFITNVYDKLNEKGYYIIKEKLYSDFCRAQTRVSERNKFNEHKFGMEFAKLLPLLDSDGKRQYYKNGKIMSVINHNEKYTGDDKKRYNIYIIPKLIVCRSLFESRLAKGFDWQNGDGEWEYPAYSDADGGGSHIPF
jgi:Family of unknown function (DUF5906)